MSLSTFAAIYVAGWLLTAMNFAVKLYREGTILEAEEKISSEITDPEMITHYENNVHGIRTKMRVLLAAIPVLFAFMFGSIWPLVWLVKLWFMAMNARPRE
jgi:hypothetical protein